MEVNAGSERASCVLTLPAQFLFVGVVSGPLKNISPARFITLFAMEMRGAMAGVGVATTALGTTKWFRCGRLLVSLLRRKFIAGGVLSAILTTSPLCFSAAIALTKVIGLVVPSTAR
jgi:hypothetical protein